jgi:hypothetical protein
VPVPTGATPNPPLATPRPLDDPDDCSRTLSPLRRRHRPSRRARAPGPVYTRSEGLGVASFRAFMAGSFSSHAASALPRRRRRPAAHVDAAALRAVFQSSPSNPMVGLEGRAGLLAHLGQVLQAEAARDGLRPRAPACSTTGSPPAAAAATVAARDVLGEVLRCLAPIWPSGSKVQGLPAGDVWPHRWAGAAVGDATQADRTTEGWVPFHKLSQWMCYSLLEPLQWAGVTVTGLDA